MGSHDCIGGNNRRVWIELATEGKFVVLLEAPVSMSDVSPSLLPTHQLPPRPPPLAATANTVSAAISIGSATSMFTSEFNQNLTPAQKERIDRQKRHRQLAHGAALGWDHGRALLEDGTLDEEAISKTTVFGPDGRTKERQEWKNCRRLRFSVPSPTAVGDEKKQSGSRTLTGSHRSEGEPDAAVSNPQCNPSSSSEASVGLNRRPY